MVSLYIFADSTCADSLHQLQADRLDKLRYGSTGSARRKSGDPCRRKQAAARLAPPLERCGRIREAYIPQENHQGRRC